MDKREAELYAQFLQEEKGATPEEAASFVKETYGHDISPSAWQTTKNVAGKTLDVVGRGLDYLGGNTRNAAMQAVDPFVDAELTKEGDTMRALKADPVGSAEYLQRAGMEPGLKNAGAGLALDIATDPLTYATLGLKPLLTGAMGASKLAKMEKAAAAMKALSESKGVKGLDRVLNIAQNPMEIMSPKAGTSLYKGAFAPTEMKIANEISSKKTPISDVLLKEGFTGNEADALQKVRTLNRGANTQIGSALKEASSQGGIVNMAEAFPNASEKISILKKSNDPATRALGEEMETLVGEYMGANGGILSPEEAYKLAKDIDAKTSSKAWKMSEGGGPKDQVLASITQDLKQASRAGVKDVDEGLYNSLLEANKTFAATDRNVQKDLLREVKNASKRKAFSQIDAGLAATTATAAATGNPMAAALTAAALAGKKGGQAITSMKGRTNIGTALRSENMKAINKYMTDPAIRQGILIDLLKDEENKP